MIVFPTSINSPADSSSGPYSLNGNIKKKGWETLSTLFILTLLLACGHQEQKVSNKVADTTATDTIPPVSRKTEGKKVDTTGVQDFKEQLHDVVERMNSNLGKVSLTDDTDNNFSLLMIINHFAGTELCKLQINQGIHPQLTKLAREKNTFLEKQDEFFDAFQLNHHAPYSPAQKQKAPPIRHWTFPQVADKDEVFATVLAEYDQNTIDLAHSYLQKGLGKDMRQHALDIIEQNQKELQQLKSFTKGH